MNLNLFPSKVYLILLPILHALILATNMFECHFTFQKDAEFVAAKWASLIPYLQHTYDVDLRRVIKELNNIQLLMAFTKSNDGTVVSQFVENIEKCDAMATSAYIHPQIDDADVVGNKLRLDARCSQWMYTSCNDVAREDSVGTPLPLDQIPHYMDIRNLDDCWDSFECVSRRLISYFFFDFSFVDACYSEYREEDIDSAFTQLKSHFLILPDPAFEDKVKFYEEKYGNCSKLVTEISNTVQSVQDSIHLAYDVASSLKYYHGSFYYYYLLPKARELGDKYDQMFRLAKRLPNINQEIDLACNWISTLREVSTDTTNEAERFLNVSQVMYDKALSKLREMQQTDIPSLFSLLSSLTQTPELLDQYLNGSVNKIDMVEPIFVQSRSASILFSKNDDLEAAITSILNDMTTAMEFSTNAYRSLLDMDTSILTQNNVKNLNIVQEAIKFENTTMEKCATEDIFNCLQNGTFTINVITEIKEAIEEVFRRNITDKIHKIEKHFNLLVDLLEEYRFSYQVGKNFYW